MGCICDDQLFIKNTPAGRAFAPGLRLAPPYEGAGDALLVEDPEDAAFAAELLRHTWAALPAPRRKKPTQKNKQLRPSTRAEKTAWPPSKEH